LDTVSTVGSGGGDDGNSTVEEEEEGVVDCIPEIQSIISVFV
jgi:hypothetical protein